MLKKHRDACERRLSVFIPKRWRGIGGRGGGEVALSNSARVYATTTPISRLPPSPWLGSAARSVIFQTAAKPLSGIKELLNRGQKPVSPRFDRQYKFK